jgi:hypothetical protein
MDTGFLRACSLLACATGPGGRRGLGGDGATTAGLAAARARRSRRCQLFHTTSDNH